MMCRPVTQGSHECEAGDNVMQIPEMARIADAATIIASAAVLVWTVQDLKTHGAALTHSQGGEPVSLPAAVEIDISEAPLLGNRGAAAVIVEFTDFECPFCASFANDELPKLISEGVKKQDVAFVVKPFPLRRGSLGESAAIVAQCAVDRGQFWLLHEKLFQSSLSPDRLDAALEAGGIGKEDYSKCSESGRAAIAKNIETGQQLKVQGTPTFFIGTMARNRKSVRTEKVMVGKTTAETLIRAAQDILSGH